MGLEVGGGINEELKSLLIEKQTEDSSDTASNREKGEHKFTDLLGDTPPLIMKCDFLCIVLI